MQVPKLPMYEKVKVELSLCKVTRQLSTLKQAIIVRPEEEVSHLFSDIALSAAASVLFLSLIRQRGNANFENLQIGIAAGC